MTFLLASVCFYFLDHDDPCFLNIAGAVPLESENEHSLVFHSAQAFDLVWKIASSTRLIFDQGMYAVSRFEPKLCPVCKTWSLSHYLDEPCEANISLVPFISFHCLYFAVLRHVRLQKNFIFGLGGPMSCFLQTCIFLFIFKLLLAGTAFQQMWLILPSISYGSVGSRSKNDAFIRSSFSKA